jgi:hypothetical protein
MVQAASYPPLQRTQGRGTQSSGTGKVKGETETRATRQIRAGNSAGIAYSLGSVAGGVAVGAVGGGAIANGINPGATSGWSPASWVSQRYQSGLGSIGQWLGTGPTAASGGMSAALAGGGAAQVAQGGCQ